MPITAYDSPAYILTCCRCEYIADQDEFGMVIFDSQKEAREWAASNNWNTSPRRSIESFLCPGCAEDEQDEAHHKAELPDAIQRAIETA